MALEPPSTLRPVIVLDDDLFLSHVGPDEHPERAARLLAVRQGLAVAARALGTAYIKVPFGDADETQLGRVHDDAYIESLGHLAGRSGFLDSDTFLSPNSVAAARRAAGSAVALVQALSSAPGQARVGFALPRPPGHHALADRAMGFCLLNNVAIAAAQARSQGHERVLVLDWDVHHGNGTEAMFYDDPAVLFVSLHQFPNYPGTGAITDVGQGEGRGATVNLPLPKGATDAVYAAAFERVVLPILEQFRPTFTLVSCGFDAHERDPLAEMSLSAAGFGAMTRSLLARLPDACPLGVVLEGGYDLTALSESSEAVARALFGEVAPASHAQPVPGAPPGAQHLAALREIEHAQTPFWKLS
jgi:acetoin utilization deacetylase AcuC-like enzyme